MIGSYKMIKGVTEMIDKNRLTAITDSIIAVAATVMVLRLDIPEQVSIAAVREQIPILAAYVISYTQIFLAWHEHHDSIVYAKKIDHRIFLMNTLWLFLITMLPFATGVLGRSPAHRPTILLYLSVLVLQVLVQDLECRMLEKLNGVRMLDAEIISVIRKVTLAGCAAAAAAAFLLPAASLWIVVCTSLASVVLMILYDRTLAGRE